MRSLYLLPPVTSIYFGEGFLFFRPTRIWGPRITPSGLRETWADLTINTTSIPILLRYGVPSGREAEVPYLPSARSSPFPRVKIAATVAINAKIAEAMKESLIPR